MSTWIIICDHLVPPQCQMFYFVVAGVLNSAVTTGSDGYACSKEFLLKDDKDSMNCVFYQIVSFGFTV